MEDQLVKADKDSDFVIDMKFIKILSELAKIDCFKPRATKIMQHKTYVCSTTRRIFVLWLENLKDENEHDTNRELKNSLVFRSITPQEFISKFNVNK